jgi:hypothetical protein
VAMLSVLIGLPRCGYANGHGPQYLPSPPVSPPRLILELDGVKRHREAARSIGQERPGLPIETPGRVRFRRRPGACQPSLFTTIERATQKSMPDTIGAANC